MAEELLKALRATRVDHKKELKWVRFLLDAYHGTGGFTGQVEPPAIAALGWVASEYGLNSGLNDTTVSDDPFTFAESYIDQYPREDKTKHRKRVQISHYQNYVETIFDLLLSYAMKSPSKPEGLPEGVKTWLLNVTVSETSWWDLMRQVIARRSALMGWCPVIVDKMPTPEGLSEAQVDELGIRVEPFVTPLTPSNILDWFIDTDGVLQWVKIKLTYVRQPDPLKSGETVEVFKIYSRDKIRTWEVVDDKIQGPEVQASNPFGEVPLVSFQHKPNVEEPIRGVSMVGDASIASRRLFNLDSEMDEHLRSNVFALLQVPIPEGQEAPKEVLAGTDNAVPVPANATRDYKYVAPPASVSETLETRIKNTVREIFRRARIQFGGEQVNQSGLAKSWDFEETNRLLSDFVAQLSIAEADVYKLVALVMGVPEEQIDAIRVVPQDNFAVEDLITDLEAAEKALVLGLGPTMDMIIKRRLAAKLAENMSPEEIAQVEEELLAERDTSLNAAVEETEEERAVREAEEAETARLAEEEATRIAAAENE